MQSKADQVLLRAEAIATQRVQGATWPQIATWLRGEGLDVSDGQVRVYWHRRYGSATPAQVLAEASAKAWEERADRFQEAAAYWEAEALKLRAERDELQAQLGTIDIMRMGIGVGRKMRGWLNRRAGA